MDLCCSIHFVLSLLFCCRDYIIIIQKTWCPLIKCLLSFVNIKLVEQWFSFGRWIQLVRSMINLRKYSNHVDTKSGDWQIITSCAKKCKQVVVPAYFLKFLASGDCSVYNFFNSGGYGEGEVRVTLPFWQQCLDAWRTSSIVEVSETSYYNYPIKTCIVVTLYMGEIPLSLIEMLIND